MGGLDPAKLLVILVLALVVLGPERLPKAARQVGALWRDFTLWRERLEQEVRSAVPDLDLPPLPVVPSRGITGYLTGLMSEGPRPAGGAIEGGLAPSEDLEPPEGAGELPGPSIAEVAGRRGRDVAWTATAGDRSPAGAGAEAVALTAPGGIPASWGGPGAEAPGYASGSFLSAVPAAPPGGPLGAQVVIDLDEPSWN
ncbi:MAG TPA: twin-arginine translocase TatA/TatE family subunit [Acidimicrobiales bacterium]|nr:twin-arginine translocase TatA/TatE family subunit [Acidimicrobiales bacterium]